MVCEGVRPSPRPRGTGADRVPAAPAPAPQQVWLLQDMQPDPRLPHVTMTITKLLLCWVHSIRLGIYKKRGNNFILKHLYLEYNGCYILKVTIFRKKFRC